MFFNFVKSLIEYYRHFINRNKKQQFILLIASIDSIHTYNYVRLLTASGKNFIIYDPDKNPFKVPHRDLLGFMMSRSSNVFLTRGVFHSYLVLLGPKLVEVFENVFFMEYFVPKILNGAIRKMNIDLGKVVKFYPISCINVLNLNGITDEFLVLDFQKIKFIILTSYGSDIKFHSLDTKRAKMLKKAFSVATHFASECHNEIEIARSLGFEGVVIPSYPNTGHRVMADELENDIENRSQIIIKGYANYMGEISIVLSAIIRFSQLNPKFSYFVYSVDSTSTIDKIDYMRLKHNIAINYSLHGELDQLEIRGEFSKSRIFLGISRCDGIQTSLLDAMELGTYPIVSNTGCAEDWITNGESGSVIRDIDSDSIFESLNEVVNDSLYLKKATEMNFMYLKKYFTKDKLNGIVKATYGN